MAASSIPVDLELHKAIEACRLTLEESQAEIVKRVLGVSGQAQTRASSDLSSFPKVRHSRRGGEYRIQILGRTIETYSLKEALKQAILLAEEKKPGFVEKLALHRTSRGRRIVARKPEELYPGKPQLVENCAERLDARWWYDTNISNDQCQRYLNILGQIGSFPAPQLT